LIEFECQCGGSMGEFYMAIWICVVVDVRS